jgi:peptidoglycan/xylan/chitin deacetylase (PgdA/CDA1 family)
VLLATQPAVAAGKFAWPAGKQAAIVLTYDDAVASQLDIAVPQLRAARLTGTFFLEGDNVTPAAMVRWRAAAALGNELGNHSVYHPCPRAMLPARERHAVENYDPQAMLAEIGVMNDILFGIDGAPRRSYSDPCSQSLAGGVDYVDKLSHSGLIAYARTGGDAYKSVVADPLAVDLWRVPSWGPIDHPDGAQLIAYVERVRAAGGLGVLQFHGVGGDYLEISAAAHRQLVEYLHRHPDIWVATFQHVMDYVSARQSQK